MAFNARDMDDILKEVPLDNNYRTEEDLHRYLVESFGDIKRTHMQRKYLGSTWPDRSMFS